MRNEGPDSVIARYAAGQFGVVSRAQAISAGLTATMIQRRLESGRWASAHPGVYVVAGAPASWLQALMAATLSSGADAVISHGAAATLFGLRGFKERRIEVTCPSRIGQRPFLVHRVQSLAAADVTKVRGIPATTAARTLIDLAAREPAERLAVALDDALLRGLVSVPRLQWCIQALAGPGRRGIALFRDLVAARAGVGPVPESALETRMLSALERHHLPPPVLQREVRVGRRRYRLDFAYVDQRVAIETVGFGVHGGRSSWEKDLARHNDLVRAGWRIVYVTWWDLAEREAETMRRIQALLDPAFR